MAEQTLPATIQRLTAADIYTGDPGAVDAVLTDIETAARSVLPDIATRKGRDAIASLAAKVARSKTYLDGLGKDLVAGWKRQAAEVDAQRRVIRERLDALKAEVRAPLTAYEQAEADRQAALRARVGAIREYQERAARADVFTSSEEVAGWIAEVGAVVVDESLDEYQAEAQQTKDATLYRLHALLTRIKDREAEEEKAEAERREAERKAREQREAEIAHQAAEQARREAEQTAAAEAERIRRAGEAEQARLQEARDAAEARERQAAEAQARAEQQAREAKQRADAAAETERQRMATEQAAAAERERRAREAREADREHRRAVNRAAVHALIGHTHLSAGDAREVIAAVAEGKVPGVAITY